MGALLSPQQEDMQKKIIELAATLKQMDLILHKYKAHEE